MLPHQTELEEVYCELEAASASLDEARDISAHVTEERDALAARLAGLGEHAAQQEQKARAAESEVVQLQTRCRDLQASERDLRAKCDQADQDRIAAVAAAVAEAEAKCRMQMATMQIAHAGELKQVGR